MSREWKPRKGTVELQPSRIRRDPARADKPETLLKQQSRSRERDILIGIVGIILFALAINALWLGLNMFIFE